MDMLKGGSSGRVLIVEDDLTMITLLNTLLEEEGFEVRSGLGWTALQLAEEFQPDVILLDIMMPVMNGLEWNRRAKTNPGLRNIPIIVLSAASAESLKSDYKDLQASSFLAKPFDLDHLLNLISAFRWVSPHSPGLSAYI